MLVKRIHGLVHILQFQRTAGGHIGLFKPSVPDTRLGFRPAKPVGSHGQERSFARDFQVLGFSDIVDAWALPQCFDNQDGSGGEADQF